MKGFLATLPPSHIDIGTTIGITKGSPTTSSPMSKYIQKWQPYDDMDIALDRVDTVDGSVSSEDTVDEESALSEERTDSGCTVLYHQDNFVRPKK